MAAPLSSYIYGRARYQVRSVLVIVRTPDGLSHHVYEGDFLPPGVGDDAIKSLLAEGHIGAFEEVVR